MSLDDLHSSLGSSDNRPPTEIVDIELDVRLLGSLVAEGEEAHIDDSELLARLNSADTVASGVEARLDEILGTLDDLLTKLEPQDTDKPQEVTISCSKSQSGQPPEERS